MSSAEPIDDDHHVVRDVKPSHLRRDGNDNVIGVEFSAFQLRRDETYLSAAWCEFHATGNAYSDIVSAAAALCNCRNIKRNAGFAVARVGDLKKALAHTRYSIRVLHEPEPNLPCHAALRRWPASEEHALLELIASEAWATTHTRAKLGV